MKALALSIISVFFAIPALACTVCGFGQDGSQWAYLLTTGIMTSIPLILFFSFVYFLRRAIKKRASETV